MQIGPAEKISDRKKKKKVGDWGPASQAPTARVIPDDSLASIICAGAQKGSQPRTQQTHKKKKCFNKPGYLISGEIYISFCC